MSDCQKGEGGETGGGGGGPEAPLCTGSHRRHSRRSWKWPAENSLRLMRWEDKDLKLTKKLERWWRQLKAKENEEGAILPPFLHHLRQRSHCWWVGWWRRESFPASPLPKRPLRRIGRGVREIARRQTLPRRSSGDPSATKSVSRSAVGL